MAAEPPMRIIRQRAPKRNRSLFLSTQVNPPDNRQTPDDPRLGADGPVLQRGSPDAGRSRRARACRHDRGRQHRAVTTMDQRLQGRVVLAAAAIRRATWRTVSVPTPSSFRLSPVTQHPPRPGSDTRHTARRRQSSPVRAAGGHRPRRRDHRARWQAVLVPRRRCRGPR